MAENSFDVVVETDRQEVDNALNQAAKEISQRYDFKNVGASIAWSGESIVLVANSSERVLAALDVFETKLVKRGISLKAIDVGGNESTVASTRIRLSQWATCARTPATCGHGTAITTISGLTTSARRPARTLGPISARKVANASGPRRLQTTMSIPIRTACRATALPMEPAPMIPISESPLDTAVISFRHRPFSAGSFATLNRSPL
jgi:hypothetical protein